MAVRESVPVNPLWSTSAGSAQLPAVSTGPATAWGPGWQDTLTTLPHLQLPSFQRKRDALGCAVLRVWGSRADGALASIQCVLWFPRQTLHIVSLPLVYHIEKFLFNYTNIKQESGQKKSFYYDSSICSLLFEIFQVSFLFFLYMCLFVA